MKNKMENIAKRLQITSQKNNNTFDRYEESVFNMEKEAKLGHSYCSYSFNEIYGLISILEENGFIIIRSEEDHNRYFVIWDLPEFKIVADRLEIKIKK